MDLITKIENVSAEEIQPIVKALIKRGEELFPDWEIHICNIQKSEDRNEQIDRSIAFIESLKSIDA